jgi:hypothetical protein
VAHGFATLHATQAHSDDKRTIAELPAMRAALAKARELATR